MAKAVEASCYGIKCDNPNCDYEDMSVRFEEYPAYLNKPCPKCGQNLLTKHDYNVAKMVIGLCKLFGRIEVPDDERRAELEIGLNGTDDVKVNIRGQE